MWQPCTESAYGNKTISWKGLENPTDILLVENLAWKHLQSNVFPFTL